MASSGLYRALSSSYGIDGLEGGRYIPERILDEKLTKEAIKNELGRATRHAITSKNCLADRVLKKKAKKLFVVLVYAKAPWDIKKLLDSGFTDEDLPLIRNGEKFLSTRDSTKKFTRPNTWDLMTMDTVVEKQWMVLAPVFKISAEHTTLDPLCPLPFSNIDTVAHSHHSIVYMATIDPSHQEGFKVDAPNLHIALKMIRQEKARQSPDDPQTMFKQERENLWKIRRMKKNVHITQSLVTFSKGNKDYIIFPWAEGGDLDNFWEQKNSISQTRRVAFWSLRQMLKLTEALLALHQEIEEDANCRHGDLKPGNILHFFTEEEDGILKIADFGISRIHHEETYERKSSTKTKATTPSYEAPEASDELPKRGARSRKYDIWSLGCIFLEFVIWLVCGLDDVLKFRALRSIQSHTNDKWAHFYQIKGDVAHVHSEVGKMIAKLKAVPKSTNGTALGDLLDLIEVNLLVVEVQDRYDAEQLCDRLQKIVQRAESDSIYLFDT